MVGATAVGKSSFVYQNLAHLPLHLISADSMQIYRGFDIGTATPSKSALEMIPHSGINQLQPDENYDVSKFLKLADETLTSTKETGRIPVVVGGTALYVRKFLYGLDEMPSADQRFRERLRKQAAARGSQSVHQQLQRVDPVSAEKIHPNDLRRTVRALEIFYQTGKTKSQLISGENSFRKTVSPLIVVLERERQQLREKIQQRVEKMVDNGLVDEVERLLKLPRLNRNIQQAIGFEEVVEYLRGGYDIVQMKGEIVRSTWKFARKQISWFDKLPAQIRGNPETDRKEIIDRVEEKITG